MRQIVLDTETTGLNPEQGHKVIELGAVELINRRATGNTFHYYLNPEREIEAEALAVHGISNEFLVDKPLFNEIAQDFLLFIKDAELIIHNAPFDIGFLNHELKQCPKKFGSVADYASVLDTLVLARTLHPGQKNSLDALCKRYQIDNSNRELHGALLDAQILADVYLAMTGGQGSLFGDDLAQTQSVTDSRASVNISDNLAAIELPVIKANQEELAAHAAFMAMLEKTQS